MKNIYLKSEKHGVGHAVFNPMDLTALYIYRNEDLRTEEFDDTEDLNDSLGRDLTSSGFRIIEKEDFDIVLIEFKKKFDLLIKNS